MAAADRARARRSGAAARMHLEPGGRLRTLPASQAGGAEPPRLDGRRQVPAVVAAHCDDPLKGYRDFLAIVEQSGWRGLVAGGKPSELTSKVHYLGYIHEPRNLAACYSAADALVVPSLLDN